MRDALFEFSTELYGAVWLPRLYSRMAREVPAGSHVMEVGTRSFRGIITPWYVPHARFTPVDRDPHRPGLSVDVLRTPVEADVILSTCVLHHTPEHLVPQLLGNLRAPLLLLSGPNAETHDPYGDHEWHLDRRKLDRWLRVLDYCMTWERVGMTEPFCEALVIARRTK